MNSPGSRLAALLGVFGLGWAVLAGACSSPSSTGLDTAVRLAAVDGATASLLAPSPDGFTMSKEGFVSPGFRASLRGDRQSLAAILPTEAHGPIVLGPGYVAPFRFTFAPVGASGAAGALDEGRVVYRGAYEGVDQISVARSSLVEQFYALSSPGSVHAFSWKVTLPSAVAKVEDRADGIWFLDARDGFLLRIPSPFYLDAQGRKLEARARWNETDHILAIDVPHEEASAYPLLLDPAFETRVWTELRAPYNMVRPNLSYDAARQETVLFGDNQTWIWQGDSWTERRLQRGGSLPGYRYASSMAFDEKRGETLLVGGVDNFGFGLDETWRWNGAEWKHAATNAGPLGRFRAALAYDREAAQIVHFGGQISNLDPTASAETWTWEGTSWQRAAAGGPSPPKRANHAMAYDEVRKRVVLFGGVDDTTGNMSDTWEWSNQAWSRVVSADQDPPKARNGHAMAYDEARKRVVLFGGSSVDGLASDTWTFDGTRWKKESPALSPPPLTEAGMTYSRATKRVLLSGGQTDTAQNNNLWSWDGVSWRVERIGDLPDRTGDRVVLFEHAQRNEIMHFTGFAAASDLQRPGYAWAHSGREWESRTFLDAPQRRRLSDMTFDAARGNVVLFGGSRDAFLQDTWTFKNGVWTAARSTRQPSARALHKVAYHPGTNRVILFGGVDDRGFPGDTWLWDGQSWTEAKPPVSPPARSGHALGLDPQTGNVVLVGGRDSNGQYLQDTWAWNGTTWQDLKPVSIPDTSRGVMLLCNISECLLVLTSREQYRFAQNAWQRLADVDVQAWNPETSPSAAWDPRLNAFFASIGATYFWKPTNSKFDEDDASFRDGPVAWTGADMLRLAESDGNDQSGTYTRDLTKWTATGAQTVFPFNVGGSAYDAARNTGAIVGRDESGKPQLWTWDGITMRLRTPLPPSTASGTGIAMAYHAQLQHTVIFGDDGPDRNVTRIWDGSTLSTWAPQGDAPPGRYAAAAAYDPKAAKVILFGGRTDVSTFSDTWAWSGNSWTKLTPPVSPPPRSNHAMTYDAELGAILLFGGETSVGAGADTWAWDGTTWAQVVTKTAPPQRALHAIAHSQAARRSIMFGGGTAQPGTTTTFPWAFYSRGGACASATDCGTGACVDGVCCEVASCGTCQTCAGTDPGTCTPILNAEDPDTCAAANNVSCNEVGKCGPALGGACSAGTDCGSGNCVDGVCCDTPCDRPCESCRASEKTSGKESGKCGVATIGSNPGKRCLAAATCSAVGVCAETTGKICRDGRYLEDLSGSKKDCAPYKCAGVCLARCSSANDCVFPAVCDATGACLEPSDPIADDAGGCATRSRPDGSAPPLVAFVVLSLATALRRGRHTRTHA